MPNNHIVPITALAAILSASGVLIALAGPLNPPAGPVASSYKTLTEVEPRIAINDTNTPGDANSVFRIAQSGSYYLTGNVTGQPAKHGIEIAADGVTIDLNGFSVAGVPGSLGGIVTDATRSHLVVRNGIVREWGAGGINLALGGTGTGAIVRDVIASLNTGDGIRAGDSAVIQQCISRGNTVVGIRAGQASTVNECSAFNSGSDGISVGETSVVTLSIAYNSTRHGIAAGEGALVTRCNVGINDGDGILLGLGSTARDCLVEFSVGVGIRSAGSSTIAGCSVLSSQGNGIVAASGSTVTRCFVWNCVGDGIVVANDAHVSFNSAIGNGIAPNINAGILATGTDNRIEFNTACQNGIGIECATLGNLIAANVCGQNATDWNLVANNRFGPIFNIKTLTTPAVSGLGTGLSGISGATDPATNFSY